MLSNIIKLKLMPTSRTVNCQLSTVNCRAKRGFTFIELLVVISIIAILVTAIIATFGGAQAKARDARRQEDLDAIKKALALFKSDTPGATFYPNALPLAIDPTYIREVPPDPSGGSYIYTPAPTGCLGITTTTANCTSFTLIACIENNNTPTGGGVEIKPLAPAPGSACAGTKIYKVINI